MALALLVSPEAQERRAEHVEADHAYELRRARRRKLLVDDDLLDRGPAAAAELLGPRAADVARPVAERLPGAEHLDPLVETRGQGGERRRGRVEELAHATLQP